MTKEEKETFIILRGWEREDVIESRNLAVRWHFGGPGKVIIKTPTGIFDRVLLDEAYDFERGKFKTRKYGSTIVAWRRKKPNNIEHRLFTLKFGEWI
jgi:hypothetical protein